MNTKEHLRKELMKGLLAKMQLQALAKLTTKKLAKKVMLKFLEIFFEEFNSYI